jgi:ATP-dependent RNA helicase DDX56/DBP9
VDTLVVDEADLVLSFGYEADVQAVAAAAPSGCQALLMSATLTAVRTTCFTHYVFTVLSCLLSRASVESQIGWRVQEVESLSGIVLHNPVVVKIEDGDASSENNLKQFVARCVS